MYLLITNDYNMIRKQITKVKHYKTHFACYQIMYNLLIIVPYREGERVGLLDNIFNKPQNISYNLVIFHK